MKFIFLVVLLFFVFTNQSYDCQSTGDPHYKNFDGKSYNLYNVEGDYILVYSANFEVQTRIQYGRFWGKQAINTAVAVRYGKSTFEVYADHYEINNKKNASFDTAGALTIESKDMKSFTVSTPSGERVIINRGDSCSRQGGDLSCPCINFDVYVKVNESIKYYGLCDGIYSNVTLAQKYRVEPDSKTNLFTLKFVREKYYSEEPWKEPEWKDEETKKKVTEFCESLNLSPRHYENCIIDGKIQGDIPPGYRRYKETMERIKKKCVKFVRKTRKHCSKWGERKSTQTRCIKRANVAKRSCITKKVCVLKKVCVTKRGNRVVKKTVKCAKYKKMKICGKKQNQSKCVKRIKKTFNVRNCEKYADKVYNVCAKWA